MKMDLQGKQESAFSLLIPVLFSGPCQVFTLGLTLQSGRRFFFRLEGEGRRKRAPSSSPYSSSSSRKVGQVWSMWSGLGGGG